MRLHPRLVASVATLALPTCLLSAQATELYVPLGIPGAGLGVAFPVNSVVGVRADYMTLGKRSKDVEERGITYTGEYKLSRGALLVDLFPFSGRFRLTVGAAFNDYVIDLDASGASGGLTIGDVTYATTAADGLNVAVKFPKTTPYVGIGWGHQAADGWRFSADIGAAIGRAKLSAVARGQLASRPDIQANLDKEVAELQDGVGKVRAIPQLSIAVGYSF